MKITQSTMISVESAAGLMFGNLQCTNMRRVMDALPEVKVAKLLAEWQGFITDRPETAVTKIINSVAMHPDLSVSWCEKTADSQLCHARIFQVIVDNTDLAERSDSDQNASA